MNTRIKVRHQKQKQAQENNNYRIGTVSDELEESSVEYILQIASKSEQYSAHNTLL